jgi:hypothetical protein
MTIVYLNGIRYIYRHERLYVGSVEIDIDRMLIDANYIDSVICPDMSSVAKYTLKALPYIDKGVYLLHTSPVRTTNILSGVFTETEDFGELFSFRTLLLNILF